jgi:hypothetical protein
MKIRIAVVAAVFLAGTVFGQNEHVLLSAARWHKSDVSEKTSYVLGYSQGYGEGWQAGQTYAVVVTNAMKSDAKQKKAADDVADSYFRSANPAIFDTPTIGQITDAMDTFYSDVNNAPVCWKSAMQVVALSLAGNSWPDPFIASIRVSDSKSGCGLPIK